MEEFLKSIGIRENGTLTDNDTFVIDLDDSDHYNKIFSILDKCEEIEENEDASVVNIDVTNILYLSEDYALNLIADFENDEYKLVVTEIGDDEFEED